VVLIPALLESPYPDDYYRRVFAAMVQDRAALIVTQLVWNNAHAALIAELAARTRLPAIYPAHGFIEQGGLTSKFFTVRQTPSSGGAKPGKIPF